MDKERIRLFNLFIALTGITLLLTLFVLTALDVIDIRVAEEVKLPIYVDLMVRFMMLTLNSAFLVYVTTPKNNFITKTLSITFLTIILYNVVPCNELVTFLTPILVILVTSKSDIKIVKKLFVCIIITTLYQFISGYIKIGFFNLSSNGIDTITDLIYSVDLYIFYYFYVKGVNNYVGNTYKSFLSTKKNSIRQDVKSSKEVLGGEEKLTTKQKVIFATMVMGYQVFQLLVVLTIGLFNQMFFELIILLIVFWIGREILKNCYHCETLRNCSLLTFSGFYIITKVSPPLSVSIFLIVILSGLFVYMLCYIGYKDNRLNMLEIRYEKDYTRYGLTKNMADFANDYLQNKLSIKQQMEKTGLSEQVVKNYRSKINKTIKNHK